MVHSAHVQISPVRRSRTDEVYDALRRMIVTLDLKPGEALVEKDLCERFSVSRTPAREAILRLAEAGLVDVAPHYGTFVTPIDTQAVRQAHFLRSNLEVPMVRLLCERDELDLARPRSLLLKQRLLLVGGDFVAFLPLDDAFHRSLFDLTRLGEIWTVIHARKAQLDRIRFLQGPQDGKMPLLVEQHSDLLDAIGRRDASAAEAILSHHIAGAVVHMEELVSSSPELFEPLHTAGRHRER